METPVARHAFFDQQGVDQLVSMVLELATQLWVVRERQYALERIVEQHGIEVRDAIDAWQPNEAQSAELAALRQQLVGELMRTLTHPHRRA